MQSLIFNFLSSYDFEGRTDVCFQEFSSSSLLMLIYKLIKKNNYK